MTTETAQLFFALLALAANAAVVGLVLAHVLAARSPATTAGQRATLMLDGMADSALLLAWVVALTCTLGSLYFSEVANFTPCALCWYQRIVMYPLALLLGIAAWQRDVGIGRYALPMAAVGAAFSLYHYLLEWFPRLDAGACSLTIPCEFVWFREFGFMTLSYMALSGFLLIAALLTTTRHHPAPEEI